MYLSRFWSYLVCCLLPIPSADAMFSKFSSGENVEKKEQAVIRLWTKEGKKTCIFEPCLQEKAYLQNRRKKTTEACKKFLGAVDTDIKKFPRIALCGSGGGIRAMYAFDAALRTFYLNGLLDAADYIATLSGSTWVVGAWIASDKQSYVEFEKTFLAHVQTKVYECLSKKNLLLSGLYAIKNLSITNTYSRNLEKILFDENNQKLTMGTLQEKITSRELPLPMFTAITAPTKQIAINPQKFKRAQEYQWCEITPFEAAFYDPCAAVPIDRLNDTFIEGVSQGKSLPLTLSDILAACSSSYAFTLNEYCGKTFTILSQVRMAGQVIPNPCYKLLACQGKIDTNLEKLNLVDAGISFSLALPPLLHRNQAEPLDLVILIDATKDIPQSLELDQARDYALSRGLNFPNISKMPEYQKRAYTLFGNPSDTKDMMILYIPLVQNSLYKNIEKHIENVWLKAKEEKIRQLPICCYVPLASQNEDIFLRDKLLSILETYQDNTENSPAELSELLNNLDLLIKAKGLKPNDYQDAIKFVEKMIAFEFEQANDGFLNTWNFKYTPEQIQLLQDNFIVAITQAEETIRTVLKQRIAALSSEDKESKEKEIKKKNSWKAN